jgi:hypothetical protein
VGRNGKTFFFVPETACLFSQPFRDRVDFPLVLKSKEAAAIIAVVGVVVVVLVVVMPISVPMALQSRQHMGVDTFSKIGDRILIWVFCVSLSCPV